MNKKQTIIILMIFFALIGEATQTNLNPFDLKNDYTEDPTFFENSYYIFLYAFFWTFLFEISLIIVLHFKQNEFYVREHSSINIMVTIGQLINNIYFIYKRDWNWQAGYFIREMAIFALITAQLFIGASLDKKLISRKLVRGIFILRYTHRAFGLLIYVLTKAQIAIYAIYFYKESLNGVFFIVLVYGLVIITHLAINVVLRSYDSTFSDAYIPFLIRNSPKKREYEEILKNIESGDIEEAITENMTVNNAFNNIDDQKSINRRLTQNEAIEWVMIEDRVYDITGLRHPKGNYILKAIRYHDITREIHGLKGWRFENREIPYKKTSIHRHVNRTFRFLQKHCIGEVQFSNVLISKNEQFQNLNETTSNINLFDQLHSEILHQKRLKKISKWNLGTTYEFGVGQDKIMFFHKLSNEVMINLSSYWNNNYGKYFLVKSTSGQCFYCFVTLSISPKYLSARENWYKKLNLDILNNLEVKKSRDFHELLELNIVLQSTRSQNAIDDLLVDDDLKDYYLPLFTHNDLKIKGESLKNVTINGPLGFGLGFNHKSTATILILVKDEGILPFTDLLEFFSQKALIEYTKSQIPHPVFGREYLLQFINGMTINLYWELSQEFMTCAKLLGIESLEIVDMIAAESSSLPIESRPQILSLLRAVTIVSNQKNETKKILTYQFESGYDYPSVKDIAMKGLDTPIERLVVSGNSKFVERVLKKVDLPLKQIVIL